MEKRKLRRWCQGKSCGGRILDVDNLDDWDGNDESRWDDTVRWQTDPYNSEINEDYTRMWLCGKCNTASRDEI